MSFALPSKLYPKLSHIYILPINIYRLRLRLYLATCGYVRKLRFVRFKPMPTLTDVITSVTTFIGSYTVYISAGLVIGLAGVALRRLIRAGR